MDFFRKKQRPTIMDLPQSVHVARDPKDEFAEIYGNARAAQTSMFIVACLVSMVALALVFALWSSTHEKVAIPWLVEVNPSTGDIARPVRMETVTPNQAVITAEIARWLEAVFTIDPKQSLTLMSEANRKTTGKAVGQFRDFRIEHDVMNKIQKEPQYLRFAKVTSVDMSQKGFAFAFVTTHEVNADGKNVNYTNYRVRVDYALSPPKTKEAILANPLGFFVTLFSPMEERK